MIKRDARTIPVIRSEKALVAIDDVRVRAVVVMHVDAVRAHVDSRVRHVSCQCHILNGAVGGIT